MRPIWWMACTSLASWLVISRLVGGPDGLAIFCGMAGPLVVASVTWRMAEEVYRHDPARLTGMMVKAFAAKLVFFGAYLAMMLRVVSLPERPLVVSFVGYFIALHGAEALCLSRLFSRRAGAGGARL